MNEHGVIPDACLNKQQQIKNTVLIILLVYCDNYTNEREHEFYHCILHSVLNF